MVVLAGLCGGNGSDVVWADFFAGEHWGIGSGNGDDSGSFFADCAAELRDDRRRKAQPPWIALS